MRKESADTAFDCDVDIPQDEAVIILDSLAAKKARSGVDGTVYARALHALVPHAASVGMRNGIVLLGGTVGRLVLLMHYLPHVTSFTFHSRCPTHSFFALAFQGRLSGGLPQGLSCLTKIHIIRPPAPYDQVVQICPPTMVRHTTQAATVRFYYLHYLSSPLCKFSTCTGFRPVGCYDGPSTWAYFLSRMQKLLTPLL